MAEMWTDAETTAMRHNHGDWHIALQNVSKDEAEQIRKNSNVAVSSWYDEINTDAEQNYYIDGKNAVLYGIEESYITDIMKYPTEECIRRMKMKLLLVLMQKNFLVLRLR